jgi:transposase
MRQCVTCYARVKMQCFCSQARHRPGALLLRNDIRYVGKSPWTEAHRHWIARLVLPNPAQRIAFEEYVQAVHECTERVRAYSGPT